MGDRLPRATRRSTQSALEPVIAPGKGGAWRSFNGTQLTVGVAALPARRR
ncbi:hypothetical protein [Haloarcula quadrata]|nr:hypothetical protein [Haloarcula quadrata]